MNANTIGRGGVTTSTSWSRSTDASSATEVASSETLATTVGVAMEGAVEVLGNGVGAGGGVSSSRGLTTTSIRTVQTGSGLELAGQVSGMPSDTSVSCEYKLQPYFYVTRSRSDFGFVQQYRVLDYLVLDNPLDRAANLTACLNPLRDIQVRDSLRLLDELLERRMQVAGWNAERLNEMPGVEIPRLASYTSRVSWFVYVIRFEPGLERDAIARRLEQAGIPARPYFLPIHLQPYMVERFAWREGDFTATEDLGRRELAVPFSGVMTEEQVETLCRVIREEI